MDTATIVSSALSPDCLEYRVVGICYWLYCTPFGCSVRTSVKVRHYVPDAVVSSYSNTGENPWQEVRAMSMPNPTAKAGGDGTTNHDNENNLRSEEHTSELQSLMRIPYAVFCLKKKKKKTRTTNKSNNINTKNKQ